MRQRIAVLGSVGVAAALVIILLWGGIVAKPVSAMEKMAESIRKAKSFKAAVMVGIKLASKNSPEPYQGRGTLYCLGAGSVRLDLKARNLFLRSSGEQDETQICVAGKSRTVLIDHKAKRVYRVEMPQGTFDNMDVVERLSGFSGDADRDLGIKEINGKKARGFEISMTKILSPSNAALVQSKDMAEVWIDAESNLPLLVQCNYDISNDVEQEGADNLFFRLQDFQWNIDLDPRLFDTAVPKGYTEVTPDNALPSQPIPAGTHVQ